MKSLKHITEVQQGKRAPKAATMATKKMVEVQKDLKKLYDQIVDINFGKKPEEDYQKVMSTFKTDILFKIKSIETYLRILTKRN